MQMENNLISSDMLQLNQICKLVKYTNQTFKGTLPSCGLFSFYEFEFLMRHIKVTTLRFSLVLRLTNSINWNYQVWQAFIILWLTEKLKDNFRTQQLIFVILMERENCARQHTLYMYAFFAQRHKDTHTHKFFFLQCTNKEDFKSNLTARVGCNCMKCIWLALILKGITFL